MLPNIWLVAKREYVKVVRRKSFWLSTLLLPVFIGVMSFVSGYSAQSSQEAIERKAQAAQNILVVDRTGYVRDELLTGALQRADDLDAGVEAVRTGEADALFYYPDDLLASKRVEIYLQSEGFLSNTRYDDMSRQLVKQSILQEIGDADRLAVYNTPLETSVTAYEAGEQVNQGPETLIIPGITLLAYFVLTSFGVGFFLMSVSEEKENRMMEIVLSILTSRELIWGKIIGLIGTVVTQFLVLGGLSALVLTVVDMQLPIEIDFSQMEITLSQVLFGVFYLLSGYFFLAGVMVGVGAAMPTYKDAQNFSSVFIILSILPIYFISIILTEPSGTVAKVLSYTPFTSPLVLLFRNALGELPLWEQTVSALLQLVYITISFTFAFKLFEIGSLEYQDKISWRRVFSFSGRKSA